MPASRRSWTAYGNSKSTGTSTSTSSNDTAIQRSISSSVSSSDARHPKYGSTKDDIVNDYPAPEHRIAQDYVGNEYQETTEQDISGRNLRGHSVDGGRLPMAFSLAGKTCVVTGGAQGTGKLLAKTLVEAGADLAIVDINDEEGQKTVEEIKSYLRQDPIYAAKDLDEDVRIKSYQCDVRSEDDVIEVFETIRRDFGRIDILTVAAGIMHSAPVQTSKYSPRKLRSPFSINVDGAFYCAREAAHFMEDNSTGGSIIIIGSMSGAGMPSSTNITGMHHPQAPYEAALAASRQMSSSLALEWAPLKIRVNCITPGPMSTALTKSIASHHPDLKEMWENLTPAGRLGQPSDLKGPLIYLASDASSYVTATNLRVDGGWSNS